MKRMKAVGSKMNQKKKLKDVIQSVMGASKIGITVGMLANASATLSLAAPPLPPIAEDAPTSPTGSPTGQEVASRQQSSGLCTSHSSASTEWLTLATAKTRSQILAEAAARSEANSDARLKALPDTKPYSPPLPPRRDSVNSETASPTRVVVVVNRPEVNPDGSIQLIPEVRTRSVDLKAELAEAEREFDKHKNQTIKATEKANAQHAKALKKAKKARRQTEANAQADYGAHPSRPTRSRSVPSFFSFSSRFSWGTRRATPISTLPSQSELPHQPGLPHFYSGIYVPLRGASAGTSADTSPKSSRHESASDLVDTGPSDTPEIRE